MDYDISINADVMKGENKIGELSIVHLTKKELQLLTILLRDFEATLRHGGSTIILKKGSINDI